MIIFELSKKSLLVSLLSLMALVMLPGCSSTEEAPPPTTETTPPPGGDDLNCDEGDTREECVDAIL